MTRYISHIDKKTDFNITETDLKAVSERKYDFETVKQYVKETSPLIYEVMGEELGDTYVKMLIFAAADISNRFHNGKEIEYFEEGDPQ